MSRPPLGKRLLACYAVTLAILAVVGLDAPAEASDNGAHLTIVGAEVDGDALDMLFTAKLDTSSVPAPGDFTVTVDGERRAVRSAQLPNRHFVRLTLSERVVEGETVSVSYAPGEQSLRALDGAEVESFGGQSVRNLTSSPRLLEVRALPFSESWDVVLTFLGALDEQSIPSGADFTVTVNGSPRWAFSVSVHGSARSFLRRTHDVASGGTIATRDRGSYSDVTLRMVHPLIEQGDVVTVSYTPGWRPLRDIDGNEVESFGPNVAANHSDPARMLSAGVDGTVLFMIFDQFILLSKLPAPTDFAVTVDGVSRPVERVHFGGGAVATFLILVLSSPVAAGEEVTLAYTRGATPLQEEYGDQVASFGPVPVENDGGRPEFSWAEVDGWSLSVWLYPRPDAAVVPEPSDFAVTVNGSDRTVDKATVRLRSYLTLAREVSLTLREPVTSSDQVTVAYAPGVTPLRHEGGDAAGAFEAMPVANVTAPAVPVQLPALRPIRTIVGISGTVADLRRAAMEACGLGIEIYATVDGDFIPFFPRLHGRIVNLAFEEAFADGLDDQLLILGNCHTR